MTGQVKHVQKKSWTTHIALSLIHWSCHFEINVTGPPFSTCFTISSVGESRPFIVCLTKLSLVGYLTYFVADDLANINNYSEVNVPKYSCMKLNPLHFRNYFYLHFVSFSAIFDCPVSQRAAQNVGCTPTTSLSSSACRMAIILCCWSLFPFTSFACSGVSSLRATRCGTSSSGAISSSR